MRPSLLAVLAMICSLGACVSNYEGDSRRKDPQAPSKTLHLYRIDIDHAAVKNGARLLFMEPPPRQQNGFQRRAQGILSVSDNGFCRVDVGCAERVVGLNGSTGEQKYTLIKFGGRVSDDGTRATTTSGEHAKMQSMRTADEVRFIERGRNKITVQAVIAGKPQAYLFHFERSPIGSKTVRIPWR